MTYHLLGAIWTFKATALEREPLLLESLLVRATDSDQGFDKVMSKPVAPS